MDFSGTKMTTSEKLKKLRKDHAMTQEDLVAKSGLGLATIQRAERGDPISADSLASLAAAFNIPATELAAAEAHESGLAFLPLQAIVTGRQLLSIIVSSSRLDFEFAETDNLQEAELIEQLYTTCNPVGASRLPTGPMAQVKLELQLTTLLQAMGAKRLVVNGAKFEIKAHEVDDEDSGMLILMGQWTETCGVIRVGVNQTSIDRAYIEEKLGKWETPCDPAIIYPARVEDASQMA